MIPLAEDYVDVRDQVNKDIKWYDRVLLNRPAKVVFVVILAAVVAPVLIYRFLFFSIVDWPPPDGHSFGSCLVNRSSRLPCGTGSVEARECHPQCCYDLENDFCFHRFPSRFSFILDREWTEDAIFRPRISTVPYASQRSNPSLKISVDEVSASHLTLTLYEPRYANIEGRRLETKGYSYEVSTPESNIIVTGPQGIIFNTVRGPLIASENIWEIVFRLSNETLFGLGELPLAEGTVKVLYNHNEGISSLPLIYAKLNGLYHGLLLDMVAPTEVSIQGDNNIVIRSITNEGLKLHLFVGPEPKNIMQDVMALLGSNKPLEYWMLGAHICSENTENGDNPDPVKALKEFVDKAESGKLYFESHCGSKPIVFNAEDDAEDIKTIEAGAEILKNAGKRFIPHVSPYIRFERDEEITTEGPATTDALSDSSRNDITSTEAVSPHLVHDYIEFMLQSDGKVYSGSVSPFDHHVAYPDYEHVDAEYMKKLWKYGMEIDGAVLVNNWPLDESKKENETYNELPYYNENFLKAFNNSPQWNINRTEEGRYIYTHNHYSNNFIGAFEKIANDIPIWSTSQWMKTDVMINRQNIDASWVNLRQELVEAALGGISGHWHWATPICGDTQEFNKETQVNLCIKWYMAGTYFPMIRIYSNVVERHPLAFEGTHGAIINNALNERTSFLPYFYTVLQDGPLLRPMFYQFPDNEDLSELSSQFSVGDDLLIAPNLVPNQSHVHVYMPPGTWYEFWSGLKMEYDENEVFTMTTSEGDFLTFIRGGSIVATQNDIKPSVEETRKTSAYSLVITTDQNQTVATDSTKKSIAEGKLFISQNMIIHFKFNNPSLTITAEGDDFETICGDTAISANVIKQIKLYGLDDNENNYDHHKQIDTTIELCPLEDSKEIVFSINT